MKIQISVIPINIFLYSFLLSLVFVGLKLAKIISMSWVLVFLPTYIAIGIELVIFIIAMILSAIRKVNEKQIENK